MGANLTTEHETNVSPTKKGGQVIVFHSSTKWRIHFEASKQDSKLDVAEEFGVQVMPNFMLLKREKVVDKVVGAKEDLQKKIEKHRFRSIILT